MGEPQSLSQRIGLTRGKALLIGALAVVLVGSIYFQYGGSAGEELIAMDVQEIASTGTTPIGSQDSARPTPVQPQAEIAVDSALAAAFDPSRWKSPDLASVTAYDPFALPEAFPQPLHAETDSRLVNGDGETSSADADELAKAIEELRLELEALQQRGVQVIVRGRDQYVAMIGDRMIHVGDEINGFTVTAIDPDGVRVERKVDQ